MKYIILILSCSVFLQNTKVSAQTEKGNWSLGIASTLGASGNNSILGFGYTAGKTGESKTELLQFNFAPRIGYVIRKDLAIGLDVVLTHSNSQSNTNTFIGAGPFARYYFKGNYLRPYAEIQGAYGNFSIKSESSFTGNQEFDVRYLSAGGAVGVAFPIKNIVHLDLAAAYNYRIGKVLEEENFNDNSHTVGLKVGVTVFLDKTKTAQN